jgi:hypothetical protein
LFFIIYPTAARRRAVGSLLNTTIMRRFILFIFFNWLSEKLFVLREDKLDKLQNKVDSIAGKYDPYAEPQTTKTRHINGRRA